MDIATHPIEVVRVVEPALLEEIYRLRAEVWEEMGAHPGNFPDGKWQDEHDLHAMHWCVLNPSGKIIAAARMCVHDKLEDVPDSHCYSGFETDIPLPAASLNRLVIKREFRRFGIGRRMDLARIAEAQTMHIRSLIGIVYECTGQKRVDNLVDLGFRCLTKEFSVSDEFTDQGLGNVVPLVKKI